MGKVYRLTEAELARACKKAYRLGARAAAEKFDRLLERMHRLKELNGSTEIFKHEWRESQHARNHGKFAPKGGGDSATRPGPEKTDKPADAPQPTSGQSAEPIPEAHLLEGLHAHVPAGSWAKVKDAVTRAAKRVHERLVLATPAILKLTDLLTSIESPDDLKVLGYTPVSGGVSGHQTPDALREATGIPGTIGAKLAAHVLSRVVHWMNRGASPEEAVGKALAEVRALAVRKAAAHAPKGGVSVQGKQYAGGEFIPAEVMANATDEEKAKVAGGGAAVKRPVKPKKRTVAAGRPAAENSGMTPTTATDQYGEYRKFGDAIDPGGNWGRLRDMPDDQPVALFHATSQEAAEAILRDGFKASSAKTRFSDSDPNYAYLGGHDGLGAYLGLQGGHKPALVVVRVKKGDLEPDAGTDWDSHAKMNRAQLKKRGIDANNPTAVDTFAEINQVRAHNSTVEAIGMYVPDEKGRMTKFVPKPGA